MLLLLFVRNKITGQEDPLSASRERTGRTPYVVSPIQARRATLPKGGLLLSLKMIRGLGHLVIKILLGREDFDNLYPRSGSRGKD